MRKPCSNRPTRYFPTSVVEYFQGYLGQPVGGFPEPLRTKVLRGKEIIEGRPGCSLPAVDFDQLRFDLQENTGDAKSPTKTLYLPRYIRKSSTSTSSRDIMGPVSLLPAKAFLKGLEIDEEIEVKVAAVRRHPSNSKPSANFSRTVNAKSSSKSTVSRVW